MKLEAVKFGWKALNDALQRIIDAINCNEPVEGQGILVEDVPSGGKMISASVNTSAGSGGNTSGSGGGGSPGTLVQVMVLDAQTGKLGFLNVYTDGNGFVGEIDTWTSLNTVDPNTCNQKAWSVLTKPPALPG